MTNRNARSTAPLRWYGGKGHYMGWLRSYFPKDRSGFVDVFGGGGSVTLNVLRSPVQVYNDLDIYLINFFTQLRDNPVALEDMVRGIELSKENFRSREFSTITSSLEQAAWFFFQFRASYSGESRRRGESRSFFGLDTEWADNHRNGYWRTVNRFEGYSERLKGVRIENKTFDDLLPQYDATGTLLYNDPPYPFAVRSDRGQRAYRHEMTNQDHLRLLGLLVKAKGMVAISSYERNFTTGAWNTIYLDTIPRTWFKTTLPTIAPATGWNGGSKRSHYREEVLWLNPAARESLSRFGSDGGSQWMETRERNGGYSNAVREYRKTLGMT